ncbi:disheveled-associated activator of morphogenesis 1 [Drosophila ficusphila]|uniref:disheveled-associated activator of morphogenesis 1 n=1 Tax=Drosophila ficusphila TaxID=30025 RepID=UPI001C897AED|nr:disheveled-associated activator of morphogenesis 1 [Drosophila ficusphila]
MHLLREKPALLHPLLLPQYTIFFCPFVNWLLFLCVIVRGFCIFGRVPKLLLKKGANTSWWKERNKLREIAQLSFHLTCQSNWITVKTAIGRFRATTKTLQSCPIVCINEPDTHSASAEILQTSAESTLEKPQKPSALAEGAAGTSVTSLNGNCIAINGGVSVGEAAASPGTATLTATGTGTATTSSSAAGVTKIKIVTSDNPREGSTDITSGNTAKAANTITAGGGYKNSSLVSITSLNSCSDLSRGSTATLPISSVISGSNSVGSHPLSGSNNHSNNNSSNNNNHSGSDTSSNNFQERFDFEHWKGLLSEYNCFHGLYRYWNQYGGRSDTNRDSGNSNSSNGNGSQQQQQQQQQSQSHHENGLGSGAGSFYTHNILGYTFGYPFGLKEDLDGGSNCNSGGNCNGNGNGNSHGLGIRKWLSGSTSSNETPLQKHYRHQQKKKMPVFRGRRAWCGCFKDDEPPEICVVEGAFTLQTLTPTQPMPSVDELDTKFAELVEELDLTAPNKEAMLSLPAQKKWQIYCSRKLPLDAGDGPDAAAITQPPTAEHYIERLKELVVHISLSPEDSPSHELGNRLDGHAAFVDALKTALRTSTHSFVLRFVELDGLPALLDLLLQLDIRVANSPLHTSLIGCIKALMNNSMGRAHVLAHPTAIDTIARSLVADNIRTKIAALEILGAVCLVPGGHRKVLQAMLYFQEFATERTRFQSIVNDLDRSTYAYRDNVNLKTALMSFVNAVLNYGPGQENLEFRLHLRYEFLMLGIQPVIDKLRTHENETLDRHLDFFEMVRAEDEKEFARRFNEEHVDTKSAGSMFELLRRKLSHSPAYPHMLSLLQHMLLLPYTGHCTEHWLLIDRVVQQIVLQVEQRPSSDLIPDPDDPEKQLKLAVDSPVHDPDVAPLQINVAKLVRLLVKEEQLTQARKRADELERENFDVQSRLAKKEQELDLRMQEKEDLETGLTRMRERLEKESAQHSQAVQRAQTAEMRAEDLQHRLLSEQQERARLERLVTEGSIPDDQKVAGLTGCNGAVSPPPAPPMLKAIPPPPPPMAPSMLPPPPPPCPGAPPPPPSMAQTMAPAPPKVELPKKNVPQPTNPLKSFNWSKLPDAKLQGTVWSELDESKLYNNMELESIDKLFSAYQKNGVSTTDGSYEDLRVTGKAAKQKVLSVIDGRRAQNCTILLSKLKMSDMEISKAILSMDSNEQLQLDMVEQLLKFTPSAEERALLDEHSEDIESLARADRFLYEISKIPPL